MSSLSPYNSVGRLPSLQYADDILLFVNTDFSAINTLKILLCGFQLVSGFKINFNKSFMYQLDEDDENIRQVAYMLNYHKGKFPLMYW